MNPEASDFQPGNPFATRNVKQRNRDRSVSILLAVATYAILACGGWVFLDICVKGAPVVFEKEFPFINVPFLTESPETLAVFETADDTVYEMPLSDYFEFKRANPDVEIVE
ncbi:MAG: hypothetical protein AAF357_13255, partial [Verrucomicrobiota bacterium]